MARTSIIGPTSIVIGDVSGQGDLEIAGRIQGDVNVLGLVHVHEEGTVLGSIRAQDIRVAGHVEGTVTARATLLLQAGAHVNGDLVAARLGIEEGARVRGSVRTEEAEAASEEEERPSADSAPVPGSGAPRGQAPRGQERRQRDRRSRHTASLHGAHPEPVPSGSGPVRPPPAQVVDPDRLPTVPKRSGPPTPVVPALAKGARGKRRPSRP